MPTAQVVVQGGRIDTRLAKNCLGMGVVRTVRNHSSHHYIADRPFDVRRDFLNHARNPEPRFFYDVARLGLHLTAKHLEQRALALAIAADQANAVASLDVERHVVEQRCIRTDTQEQVLGGKNRHGLATIPVPARWHRTRAVLRFR